MPDDVADASLALGASSEELPSSLTADDELGVSEALRRVCASDIFARASQLRRLLEYLVQCALAKRENLKAYTVGIEAFGRSADFDPERDTIVRVQATRLRRLLRKYYASQGASDPIEIRLPTGGYVVEFKRKDQNVRQADDEKRPVRMNEQWRCVSVSTCLAACIIAAFVLSVASYLPEWTQAPARFLGLRAFERERGNGLPTIVLKPFANAGSDIQTDGLRRHIATALARFEFANILYVPSDGDKDATPSLIPTATDTSSVYTLSAAAVAEYFRLQLRFQLADNADGSVVWARTFELSTDIDNAALQADLVRALATDLAQPFGVVFARERVSRMKSNVGDPRYLCILRAVESLFIMSGPAYLEASDCLQRVVQIDPGFSLAYSYLSVIYNRMYLYGLDKEPAGRPLLGDALRAANRAVQTNPASTRAHFALFISLYNHGDFEGAHSAIKKALELNENDQVVRAEYGGRLIAMGQIDEGQKILERIDSSLIANTCTNTFYVFLGAYLRGDVANARRHANNLSCLNYPNSFLSKLLIALATHDRGAAHDASDSLRALLPIWRSSPREAIRRMLPDPTIANCISRDLEAAEFPLTDP